jgi:hypothetical protein
MNIKIKGIYYEPKPTTLEFEITPGLRTCLEDTFANEDGVTRSEISAFIEDYIYYQENGYSVDGITQATIENMDKLVDEFSYLLSVEPLLGEISFKPINFNEDFFQDSQEASLFLSATKEEKKQLLYSALDLGDVEIDEITIF